ncbi:MAG TPA: hypothetical protein VMT88_09365 [Actinomycetes bacterium]|nr:hypothetical protein [Actinomycetes bacterium]
MSRLRQAARRWETRRSFWLGSIAYFWALWFVTVYVTPRTLHAVGLGPCWTSTRVALVAVVFTGCLSLLASVFTAYLATLKLHDYQLLFAILGILSLVFAALTLGGIFDVLTGKCAWEIVDQPVSPVNAIGEMAPHLGVSS